MDDAFLKKGILLMVDGTDPELVRAIMETELVSTYNFAFLNPIPQKCPFYMILQDFLSLVYFLLQLFFFRW